jgi:hypothetical protein
VREPDLVPGEDGLQREADVARAVLAEREQISDGLNKKRSDADTTVISASSPSAYLSSRAAVRPPKFPPITSTRLPAMALTQPSAPLPAPRSGPRLPAFVLAGKVQRHQRQNHTDLNALPMLVSVSVAAGLARPE